VLCVNEGLLMLLVLIVVIGALVIYGGTRI
jgi:hypothetical protein